MEFTQTFLAWLGESASNFLLDIATGKDMHLFSRKGTRLHQSALIHRMNEAPGSRPVTNSSQGFFFASCSGSRQRFACGLCGHQSGPQTLKYQKRETRSTSSWSCFQQGCELWSVFISFPPIPNIRKEIRALQPFKHHRIFPEGRFVGIQTENTEIVLCECGVINDGLR